MLPFAVAIFTGAFLLFQVQPIIGKFILPWFGGSPGVWTTCLLFFQTLLLGGYAYAHFSTTYLKPKTQALLHMALLGVSLVLLPITPSETWKSHVEGDPVGRILLLLTVTIGLPYFVLSATGPLMQRWFSETSPGLSPYRLYALSNIGSLLALLSYPFFFEVKFTRQEQSTFWSVGLLLFVGFCGWCAWRVWRRDAPTQTTEAGDEAGAAASQRSPWADRLLWVGFPAIASILLMATTNKLSQEVAVIPFLWVLPLSLYLLSFILCFDHGRWYVREIWVALLMVCIALVCQLLAAGTDAPMWFQVVGYSLALFAACMVCHGELYRLRPPARRLTGYYLSISAGGALGGLMVAVVAPATLNDYRELQAGLWMLSYALGVVCLRQQSRELALAAGVGAMIATFVNPILRGSFKDGLAATDEFMLFYQENGLLIALGLLIFVLCVIDLPRFRVLPTWEPRMAGFMMTICFGVGVMFFLEARGHRSTPVLSASRNFYGTLKVYDYQSDSPEQRYRLLLHGATTHGFQFVHEDRAMWKTTYYTEQSGVGRAIAELPESPRRLGLVGLGTGTLAAYGREGDYLRIYEINPEVERLARTQFSFLERSPAKTEVIMGDARLAMEREVATGQAQQFDLLALDAFSSDAIPVHLLTAEAFKIYLQHLKPDGVIAVHISNRYLDLRPIVENLAAHLELATAAIHDDDPEEWWMYRTTWILVTKNKVWLERERIKEATDLELSTTETEALWTDDYASLYPILK